MMLFGMTHTSVTPSPSLRLPSAILSCQSSLTFSHPIACTTLRLPSNSSHLDPFHAPTAPNTLARTHTLAAARHKTPAARPPHIVGVPARVPAALAGPAGPVAAAAHNTALPAAHRQQLPALRAAARQVRSNTSPAHMRASSWGRRRRQLHSNTYTQTPTLKQAAAATCSTANKTASHAAFL